MDSIINLPFEQLGPRWELSHKIWKWAKIVLPCLLKSRNWFPVLPWALKNLLSFKDCHRWGTHLPPGSMEKSKTAGFTHYQFLCYILVLGLSYCDVWLHQPLMSTNITFQRLSRGLGSRFWGTLFWLTSSPSLTMFNKTKFWSIIYNLQSTALAFFNLQYTHLLIAFEGPLNQRM